MSFIRPWFLLWGLFLPLIVILHFQKKQVKEFFVPDLALWERIIIEQEGIKIPRIRDYLLLALQLLAAALLVLSLAGLSYARVPPGGQVTLVLDGSFSMQAREHGVAHFQEAREEVVEYLQRLPRDTKINLLLLRGECEELLKYGSKKEAERAVETLRCSAESLNLDLAGQVLNTYPGETVVFSNKELRLGEKLVRVGKGFENAGITAARYDYSSHNLMCRVKNYSSQKRTVTVEAGDGKGVCDLKAAEVPAGKEAWLNYHLPEPGLYTIHIKDEDILAEDNRYFLPVGEEYKKKALLKGENFFLEKALSAMPGISYEKINNDRDAGDEAVLIVTDYTGNETGVAAPREGVWFIRPSVKPSGQETKEKVSLALAASPLKRGLKLQGIQISAVSGLAPRTGFTTAVLAGGEPLVIYGLQDGVKTVYSLDLSQTGLALLPAYPILVNNIMEWLAEEQTASYAGNPPAELVTGKEAGKEAGEEAGAADPPPAVWDLTRLLLITVLCLLLLEGEVYRRGI